MRRLKIILSTFLLLLLLNSCQLNWYGDIELGKDFYYIVEPAFNSIVIPVNPDEPYTSSIYVIRDIESLGFNEYSILATSKFEQRIKYWKIDKTLEAERLGYGKDSIMKLSNISEIDSLNFYLQIDLENIRLKTKTEYRKELGYE